jgi:hypothetical protein
MRPLQNYYAMWCVCVQFGSDRPLGIKGTIQTARRSSLAAGYARTQHGFWASGLAIPHLLAFGCPFTAVTLHAPWHV